MWLLDGIFQILFFSFPLFSACHKWRELEMKQNKTNKHKKPQKQNTQKNPKQNTTMTSNQKETTQNYNPPTDWYMKANDFDGNLFHNFIYWKPLLQYISKTSVIRHQLETSIQIIILNFQIIVFLLIMNTY